MSKLNQATPPDWQPRICKCGGVSDARYETALARRTAVDAKYIGLVSDHTRWFSQGLLSYEHMRSNVKLALKMWIEDRDAIGG